MLISNNYGSTLTIWFNGYNTTKTSLIDSYELTLPYTTGTTGETSVNIVNGYYLIVCHDTTNDDYILYSILDTTQIDITNTTYTLLLSNNSTTNLYSTFLSTDTIFSLDYLTNDANSYVSSSCSIGQECETGYIYIGATTGQSSTPCICLNEAIFSNFLQPETPSSPETPTSPSSNTSDTTKIVLLVIVVIFVIFIILLLFFLLHKHSKKNK